MDGRWDNSPIELIVYGFKESQNIVQTLRSALCDVAQPHQGIEPFAFHTDQLLVRELEHVARQQTSARICWDPGMWTSGLDLVKEMGTVKSHLQERGYEVFWASTAGQDHRSTVKFSTVPVENRHYLTIRPGFAPDRTTWVQTACSEELYQDIADSRVVYGNNREEDTVEIDFRHPSSVDKMMALFDSDKRRQWFKMTVGITQFSRIRSQIPIAHPAMIASPDRGHYGREGLLAALDKWVAEYNATFKTTERLLPWEDGSRGKFVFETNFVVLPSSVGLAQFIAQQQPRHGYPFELLYDLNGRCLVPASQAAAKLELERLQEVRYVHKRLKRIERRLRNIKRHTNLYANVSERIEGSSQGWVNRDFTSAVLDDLQARISRGHGLSYLYGTGDSSEPEESSEEEQPNKLDNNDHRTGRGQLDVDPHYGERSFDDDPPMRQVPVTDYSTAPTVSATRFPAQAANANGLSTNSPVELIIDDLPFDMQKPELAVIGEVLQQLEHNHECQPPIDWRRLILSEEPGPGYTSTRIRLSWSEDKWMNDVNLVDEMSAVRQALQDSGYRVFWANAPVDLRNVSDIEMRDNTWNARPVLECRSFKWLYDQCVKAGVEPVDASGGRLCPEYHKYRLTFRSQRDTDMFKAYLNTGSPRYGREPVLLHEPQIAVSYPTNVGSPGRGNMSPTYLLAEVERWVAAYNVKHNTHECLLHMEGDKCWGMTQGVFIVRPSSMHLSEYLTRQVPRCGQKYELLYTLNSRQFPSPAEAQQAVWAQDRWEKSIKEHLKEIGRDLWHIRYTVCNVMPDFWDGGNGTYIVRTPDRWGSDAESMSSWSSEAKHLLDP